MLRVGTKFLTQSAAYTPKFARTVMKLHLKHMDPAFSDLAFILTKLQGSFNRTFEQTPRALKPNIII